MEHSDVYVSELNYTDISKEEMSEIEAISFECQHRPNVILFAKENAYKYHTLLQEMGDGRINIQFVNRLDKMYYKRFLAVSPGLDDAVENGVKAVAFRIYNETQPEGFSTRVFDMMSGFVVDSKGQIFYFYKGFRKQLNVSFFVIQELDLQ